MVFNPITFCNPKTPTDVLIARCLQLRIERRKDVLLVGGHSDGLPIRGDNMVEIIEEFRITKDDTFSDSLTKCAVIHLTDFYRQFRENKYVKDNKLIVTCSHYMALYWYTQKNMMRY